MSTSPQSHPSSDYGSDIGLPDLLNTITTTTATTTPTTTADDLSSDYGSDIDLSDPTILNLLDNPPPPPPPPSSSQLYPPLPIENDFTGLEKVRVKTSTRFGRDGTLVVQYDELVYVDQPTITVNAGEAAMTLLTTSDTQLGAGPTGTILPARAPDTRSPYERFRSRRGHLSVTDLVSNVWCEQQFMYTLERGFRRDTPAMKKGRKEHKILEEQVHTTVPFKARTMEDRWGLRLFNMYQSLVSLEECGITREMEVFGWLGGVFVNGVIDEITYDHPSPEMLQQTQSESQAPTSDAGDGAFTTCPSSPISTPFPTLPFNNPTRIAYITDTKTRTVSTVPKTSQLSTSLQLFLYHILLTSLPSMPFTSFLKHHKLFPMAPFSDSFIAQVGSIDSSISLSLLENNSLPGLWDLFLVQYHKTIERVGDVVGVTYRSQDNGEVIAERSWKVEDEARERHLADVMSWWKGKRRTKGVAVEEAWKCRTCDFEDTCSWRLEKLEEIRKCMRAGRGVGENSDVVVNAGVGAGEKADVVVSAEVGAGEKGGVVSTEVEEAAEENTDVAVNAEVKWTVGEGVKKRRGRPRKNVQKRTEDMLEEEGIHSGGSEVSTKGRSRARSRPRKTEPDAEGGESKEKKKGRGTPKGRPNVVSGMELF